MFGIKKEEGRQNLIEEAPAEMDLINDDVAKVKSKAKKEYGVWKEGMEEAKILFGIKKEEGRQNIIQEVPGEIESINKDVDNFDFDKFKENTKKSFDEKAKKMKETSSKMAFKIKSFFD